LGLNHARTLTRCVGDAEIQSIGKIRLPGSGHVDLIEGNLAILFVEYGERGRREQVVVNLQPLPIFKDHRQERLRRRWAGYHLACVRCARRRRIVGWWFGGAFRLARIFARRGRIARVLHHGVTVLPVRSGRSIGSRIAARVVIASVVRGVAPKDAGT